MGRLARLKIEEGGAWYHLYCSVAGHRGQYPLEQALCQRKLIRLLRFYASVYCMRLGAFAVMGNHYHAVANFEEQRSLSRKELRERAHRLYPRSEPYWGLWTPKRWKRFEQRLFDVSEYMRNVQSAFARWYNRQYDRKGRFWADRFKSTLLLDPQAVLDCVLYVELNPMRAGLVAEPEEWEGSSLFFRELKKDQDLAPLEEILGLEPVEGAGRRSGEEAYRQYKGLLYYRGTVPTKETHASLDAELVKQEEARGFERRGVYLKRLRYFTDGVVLGGEEAVRRALRGLRKRGAYLRRLNPTALAESTHFSLREQRGNFVPLG